MIVQGQAQLGFLPSDDYASADYGAADWYDAGYWGSYWAPYESGGWGWPDYGANFDPITGDYVGSYAGYWDPVTGEYIAPGDQWIQGFDPILGDYGGQPEFTLSQTTREPYALPPGPSGNWWDFLVPILPQVADWFGGSTAETPPAPDERQAGGQALPGYCPGGTYHPYPIGHPQQDLCVPFPPDSPVAPKRQQSSQQQRAAAPQRSAPQQQQPKCPQGQVYSAQLQRCIPQCPKGQVFNPQQNRCVTPPQCPQGLQFNPQTGRCEEPGQTFADIAKGIPWWIWLMGGLVVWKATEPSSSGYTRRRR